jgi:hypothetical protein
VAASVSLSPSERSQRGRIGAYAQKAKHDPKETTRKAREVYRAQFYEGSPRIFPRPSAIAAPRLRSRLTWRGSRSCRREHAGRRPKSDGPGGEPRGRSPAER